MFRHKRIQLPDLSQERLELLDQIAFVLEGGGVHPNPRCFFKVKGDHFQAALWILNMLERNRYVRFNGESQGTA